MFGNHFECNTHATKDYSPKYDALGHRHQAISVAINKSSFIVFLSVAYKAAGLMLWLLEMGKKIKLGPHACTKKEMVLLFLFAAIFIK
ncbi:hypothetical protein CEXT_721041 [Caerostris extrusa]|uniref:Uncharacterized protein n=1 Tax=Caerostris extrusa TaxID=172846 RepID=A0AAV4PFA1_CAEEX|nr:hypothetical protein CEXT_721041 [Caerostris extrusa]